jgi:molybdopterin converting factor small subunit
MKVLFFGALAEITGKAEMELSGFEDTASLQQEL